MDVPPVIAHRFIFGLKSDCNNNVHFGEDDTVIYPAGHTVVVYNPRTHTQQFLFGSDVNDSRFEKAEITAISVSPNKRFCAIAERGVTHGTIAVFDLHTFKRKRLLTCTDLPCTEYVALCFSPDSSRLFSLASGSHASLLLWSWSSSKVLHIERLASSAGFTALAHAASGGMVAVAGASGVLFVEEASTSPYLRVALADDSDPLSATSQYWVSAHTLLVGSSKGHIAVYRHARLAGMIALPALRGSPIVGLVAVQEGVLAVARSGDCAVLRSRVSDAGQVPLREGDGEGGEDAEPVEVSVEWRCTHVGRAGWGDNARSVASSPEYGVCVSTEGGQLVRVWGWGLADSNSAHQQPGVGVRWGGTDASEASGGVIVGLIEGVHERPPPLSLDRSGVEAGVRLFPMQVRPVVSWAHSGAITGMDICVRTGVAVTCGVDHTLRVWNLQHKSLVFTNRFPDPPLAVALHPSGWMLLVAFPDRVCFCMLLHRAIKVVRDWPLKHAAELAFARGGHMFAVATAGAVHIIHTYTGRTVHALRGHVGAVRALAWLPDDASLVSAGADGDVQERSVETGARTREFVQKGCRFLGAAAGSDGAVLVAGDDHVLKQLSTRGVAKALDAGLILTQLALARPPERMLFAGTATGVVRSFAFPLTGDAKDYQCHRGPVTRLRLGEDDATMASAGEDGCLALWDVRDHRAGRRITPTPTGNGNGQPVCSDVVVSVHGIEELRNAIQNLESRLRELSEERDSADSRLSAAEEQQIRKLTEESVLKLENGRARIEAHRDEAQERDAENQEKILAVQHQHNGELQAQAVKYQQAFMREVARLQHLQEELEDLKQQRKENFRKLKLRHANNMSRAQFAMEEALKKAVAAREAAESAHALVVARFSEDRQQTETDLDTEVELLTHKYQARLEAERDTTLRLKGETGLMNKKYKVLVSDREDLGEARLALQAQEEDLLSHLQVLRSKAQEQQHLIAATDAQIAEREKQIYELKKHNQALERHRFVVGFQVSELKREMAPCEAAVARLQVAVGALSRDLEGAHRSNGSLETEARRVVQRLQGAREELLRSREEVRVLLQQCGELNLDTLRAVECMQDSSTLRDAALQLHRKYVCDTNKGTRVAQDVAQEYKRHIEYLSSSVRALKKQVARDGDTGKAEHLKLMRENAGLIREINSMRRELKMVNISGRQSLPGARKLPPVHRGKGRHGAREEDYVGVNAWRLRQNENLIDRLRAEVGERQTRLQQKNAE